MAAEKRKIERATSWSLLAQAIAEFFPNSTPAKWEVWARRYSSISKAKACAVSMLRRRNMI
jgi:hypothetical protein